MQNYKYIYTNAAGGLHHKSIFLIFIYFENRVVIINLVPRVRVSPFRVSAFPRSPFLWTRVTHTLGISLSYLL